MTARVQRSIGLLPLDEIAILRKRRPEYAARNRTLAAEEEPHERAGRRQRLQRGLATGDRAWRLPPPRPATRADRGRPPHRHHRLRAAPREEERPLSLPLRGR